MLSVTAVGPLHDVGVRHRIRKTYKDSDTQNAKIAPGPTTNAMAQEKFNISNDNRIMMQIQDGTVYKVGDKGWVRWALAGGNNIKRLKFSGHSNFGPQMKAYVNTSADRTLFTTSATGDHNFSYDSLDPFFSDGFDTGGLEIEWAIVSGDWNVYDYKLVVSGVPGTIIDQYEPELADYSVSVAVSGCNWASGFAGLVGRQIDADNRYETFQDDGAVSLFKRVSGAPTQLGASYTHTPVANEVVTLYMKGDQISVQLNGTTIIGPVTDTAFASAGVGGLRGGYDATFDDFKMTYTSSILDCEHINFYFYTQTQHTGDNTYLMYVQFDSIVLYGFDGEAYPYALMLDILNAASGEVSADTSQVQVIGASTAYAFPTFDVPEPTTMAEVQERANAVTRWDYGFDGLRRLYYRPSSWYSSVMYTCYLSLGATYTPAPTADGLFSDVHVKYNPASSVAWYKDAVYFDLHSDCKELDAAGLIAEDLITIESTSPTDASAAAAYNNADSTGDKVGGTLTLKAGQVFRGKGPVVNGLIPLAPIDPWLLKEGHSIRIVDSPLDDTFGPITNARIVQRINFAEWNDEEQEMVLTLDAADLRTLEGWTERMTLRLEPHPARPAVSNLIWCRYLKRKETRGQHRICLRRAVSKYWRTWYHQKRWRWITVAAYNKWVKRKRKWEAKNPGKTYPY